MGENEIQRPTVGRIVHYHRSPGSPTPIAATVVAESWMGPLYADLALFDPNEVIERDGDVYLRLAFRRSVPHASLVDAGPCWDWPARV